MSCSSRHTSRFDALLQDALILAEGDMGAAADLFLGWVLSGEEPILIRELAHALAVETGGEERRPLEWTAPLSDAPRHQTSEDAFHGLGRDGLP